MPARDRPGNATATARSQVVALTYRTTAVARLAGATALLGVLAVWGFVTLLASGETTTGTWALGLASMFPISALLLGFAGNRPPPRPGVEYAVGLVGGVVVLSVSYIGLLAVDNTLVGGVAGVDPLGLAAAALGFGLLGGLLTLVDVRYVERPETAASLEHRYLDRPVRED